MARHLPQLLFCTSAALIFVVQGAVLQVDQTFDQEPLNFTPLPANTWQNEDNALLSNGQVASFSEDPDIGWTARAVFQNLPITSRDVLSVACSIRRAASPGNAVNSCYWGLPSRGMGHVCDTNPTTLTNLSQNFGTVTLLDVNDAFCDYGGTLINPGAFLVDSMSREVSVSLTTSTYASSPRPGSPLTPGGSVVVLATYWDTSGRLGYECGFTPIDPGSVVWETGTVINETALSCPIPAPISPGNYTVTVQELSTESLLDESGFQMAFYVAESGGPTTEGDVDGDTDADDDGVSDQLSITNPLVLGGIGAAAAVIVFGGALFARSRSPSSVALASEKGKSPSPSSASSSASGPGGKKRRTIGLAIDDLMSKMTVMELANYAAALVDNGNFDEALALLVKLEQRSANGGTVAEYLRVIEVMSVLFVRKGGRQDELKAVKEAQRQSVNVKGHKMKGGLMKGKAYQRLQEEAEVVSKKPASRKNPRPRAASGGRKGSNAAGSSGGGKKKVRSGSTAVSNTEMWELSSVRSVAKEFTTVPISSMMSDGSRSYKSVTSSQAPHFRSEGSRSVGRS